MYPTWIYSLDCHGNQVDVNKVPHYSNIHKCVPKTTTIVFPLLSRVVFHTCRTLHTRHSTVYPFRFQSHSLTSTRLQIRDGRHPFAARSFCIVLVDLLVVNLHRLMSRSLHLCAIWIPPLFLFFFRCDFCVMTISSRL